MFNVCYGCGTYSVAKYIEHNEKANGNVWAVAECPTCGFKHKFMRLPLFIICGASGTGKTAVCRSLNTEGAAYIALEGDILWCPAFDKSDNNYRDFFEVWLRMSKNINQSGRPVVLFNAGAGVPANLQDCIELRYFSAVHTLVFICDDTTLTTRLRNRPSWRGCSDAFIQEQLEFNRWYSEVRPTLDPSVTLLDTSSIPVTQTVVSVNAWITAHLFPTFNVK